MHVFAARVGLVHIGVFILLLLSGERNFGVRLNKPYCVRVPMDISVFAGTHADLLIVVRETRIHASAFAIEDGLKATKQYNKNIVTVVQMNCLMIFSLFVFYSQI